MTHEISFKKAHFVSKNMIQGSKIHILIFYLETHSNAFLHVLEGMGISKICLTASEIDLSSIYWKRAKKRREWVEPSHFFRIFRLKSDDFNTTRPPSENPRSRSSPTVSNQPHSKKTSKWTTWLQQVYKTTRNVKSNSPDCSECTKFSKCRNFLSHRFQNLSMFERPLEFESSKGNNISLTEQVIVPKLNCRGFYTTGWFCFVCNCFC